MKRIVCFAKWERKSFFCSKVCSEQTSRCLTVSAIAVNAMQCSVRRKHWSDATLQPNWSHIWLIVSGDQLSVQNSLKINIKFFDSLLDIDFYSLTIIFCLRFFPWHCHIFNFLPLTKWSVPWLSSINLDSWSADHSLSQTIADILLSLIIGFCSPLLKRVSIILLFGFAINI